MEDGQVERIETHEPEAEGEAPRVSTRELVARHGLTYGPIVGFANVLAALLTWLIGGAAPGADLPSSSGIVVQNILIRATVLSLLLPLLVLLWTLVFTFLAGRATGRATGSAGAGSLSGLVAGGFAGVAGLVMTLLILFLLEPAQARNAAIYESFYSTPPQVVVALTIGAIVGLAFDLALGAGMGALGGLAGRSTFHAAHPVSPPAVAAPGIAYYPAPNPYPYPYAPYPGQPPAPLRQE